MSRALRRSLVLGALALLALPCVCECGPALRHDPRPAPSGQGGGQFTLATFNLEFDAWGDSSTVELVGRTGADVIFLQEVSHEWERVLRRRYRQDYPEMLFAAAGGASGLGVISRFPLRDEGLLPAVWKHPAWLVAVLTPWREVHVLNVHLRASRRPHQNLIAGLLSLGADHEIEIRRFVAACTVPPTLVVGDFNEGRGGAAVEWLERQGFVDGLGRFRPGEPTARALGGLYESTLDHILFRPSFPALDVWVLRGGSSDHWPVLARF
ncbi:MAG TPA: endonuclease/exonuclease/phosphatase family protein [Polyangiaceae bacterium]|jgi:endonuclease/exonuclease/phosphatase (EEP) superfamily protein YafD|nr:endonuclease/exonuclease/phosphatase family protein [Polyangiaceae bacterium]